MPIDKVHYNLPNQESFQEKLAKKLPKGNIIDKFIPASFLASTIFIFSGILISNKADGFKYLPIPFYTAGFLAFYKKLSALEEDFVPDAGKGGAA